MISVIEKFDLPYKYVGDGELEISGLFPDFVHERGEKKIIEVFGRYWHETAR